MRAAIWIAVLLAAFVLAWQIQDRWSDARRAERDAAYARAPAEPVDWPAGFGRVVVGAPSGAAPIEGLAPRPAAEPGSRPAAESTPRPAAAPAARHAARPAAPEPARLRRHVVRRGDSLSQICAAVYGTARRDVVEAVARANGLTNPGAIREGQELVLPALEDLARDGR